MGIQKLQLDLANLHAIHGITEVMKSSAGAKFQNLKKTLPGFKSYSDSVKRNREIANLLIKPGDISIANLQAEIATHGAGFKINPRIHKNGLDAFLQPVENNHVLLLVISSNRGFCGSFNREVCQESLNRYKKFVSQGKNVKVICIGRKAGEFYRGQSILNIKLEVFPEKKEEANAQRQNDLWLSDFYENEILSPFLNGVYSEIHVVFSPFEEHEKKVITIPTMKKLLPLSSLSINNTQAADIQAMPPENQGEYQFQIIPGIKYLEPGPNLLLASLIEEELMSALQTIIRDSETAENYQRMRAMNQASEAVEIEIKKVTGVLQKTRQTNITRELVEIISGAEALKKK
jgi:F-type H+-transporting ATPase subunit gamma